MKKFRLIVCAAAAMLLGTLNAGAITYSDPSTVAKATGDEGTFYLYNVGTGLYLAGGGSWGTQAVTAQVGEAFTFTANESIYYINSTVRAEGVSETGRLGLMLSGDDKDEFYTDRPTSDASSTSVQKYTFTEVTGQTNTYQIKCDNKYMVATGANKVVAAQSSVAEGNEENSYWRIVTLASTKKDFQDVQAATASEAKPAVGTFLIYDQNFNRKNTDVSYWHTGSSIDDAADGSSTLVNGNENVIPSSKGGTTNSSYTYYYQCTYRTWNGNTKHTGWITNTTGTEPTSCDQNHKNATFTTSLSSTNTYYVGNGYQEAETTTVHDGDTELTNGNYNRNKTYGDVWTANIHGQGVVVQTYQMSTASASGWYIVSCEGFTTEDGSAQLFFRAGDGTSEHAYGEENLTYVSSAPATYAQAGKLLQEDGYSHSVMIYVEAGQKIYFGVKTTDASTSAWACFDNFQIKYVGGEKDHFLILDELQESMDYINTQVDPIKSYTMVLQRSLKANQWGSLILPVTMDAQKVKLAFGDGVKLSKIVGMDAETNYYRLNFKSVDLSKGENEGIVPGTLYIIKPTKAPTETPADGGDTYMVETRTVSADNVVTYADFGEIKFTQPYYLVNQVSLKAAPKTDNGIVEQDPVDGNDKITGKLTFKGTYINQTKEVIPAHSFVLSSNTGAWYLTENATYAVKGFRTWIETEKITSDAQVSVFNDGVEMGGGEVTGISNVLNDLGINTNKANKVYSINGQLVRSGSASLEGLAKGVYIVNGNKYIVK